MKHRRRSSDQAESRNSRIITQLATGCAAISMSACLIVSVLALTRVSQTSERACAAVLDVRSAMVDVLADAKRRTERQPARTPREREQAAEFYSVSLARLNRVRCRS